MEEIQFLFVSHSVCANKMNQSTPDDELVRALEQKQMGGVRF